MDSNRLPPFSLLYLSFLFAWYISLKSVFTLKVVFLDSSALSATSAPISRSSRSRVSRPLLTPSSTSASVSLSSTAPSVRSTDPRSAASGDASPAPTVVPVPSRPVSATTCPPSLSVPPSAS